MGTGWDAGFSSERGSAALCSVSPGASAGRGAGIAGAVSRESFPKGVSRAAGGIAPGAAEVWGAAPFHWF